MSTTESTYLAEQIDATVNDLNELTDTVQGIVRMLNGHRTRSDQRRGRLAKSRERRGQQTKRGYEHKGDRKQQILDLTAEGRTPKQVAEQLGTHVNYVYLVRRNAMREAPKSRRTAKRAASKSAGKQLKQKGDRRDQILALTKKGRTPKQIAEALGTHVNYVYLVRRNAARKAA